MEVNPLSIILVKSHSKGDRLLFRYPFQVLENIEPSSTKRKNPYTLPNVEDLLHSPPQPTSNINKGHLTGFSDEALSSLFAVKLDLFNKKFELKVNDVRFISHPTQLLLRNKQQDDSRLLINVVFALQACASPSVVKCYHDLSKKLGIALKHEEQRNGFVYDQIQIMATAHDDGYANSEEAYYTILEKCSLAKNMKKMYEDLCGTGLVNIRLNKWVTLSFCLPQKVHQWHLRGKILEPEDIDKCISGLRPYHSLLLLFPVEELLGFISSETSPTLFKMLQNYSALKNLQTLATDSEITIKEMFDLTGHLVYWAKATVIFPICSSNKYVIAPDAPIYINSPLVDKFKTQFPARDLIRVIDEFSLPVSLGQKCNPLCHPSQQSQLVQTVVWMLQHHLLSQVHMYIQYMPMDNMVCPSDGFLMDSTLTTLDLTKSINFNSKANSNDNNNFDEEPPKYQDEQLLDFPDREKVILFKIASAHYPEDLKLFANLSRKGYFKGNHHIEEIMYLENLRRGQLMQLLDKFRDVLITYETEDPIISKFSCS